MQKRLLLLPLIIILMLTAACSPAAQAQADFSTRPIRVVATTGMIADLVEHVGGERVQVTGLMGPGVDPHLYKASEGDVMRLAGADLVLYNGLHLEAQMARVFDRMSGRIHAVAVGERIDPASLLHDPEYEEAYDPHIWYDVALWMEVVEVVRDVLVEMDPAHRSLYEANASAYLAELEILHTYVLEQAARLPAEQRVLITAHDAFSYFGRAYGFDVRGLQGISTASEASAADVQALAAFIAERRIPAIFVEASAPTRTIEAVQAAVRARNFDVQIGGELFTDALGSAGTPEVSYTGVVRYNIDTITRAILQEP